MAAIKRNPGPAAICQRWGKQQQKMLLVLHREMGRSSLMIEIMPRSPVAVSIFGTSVSSLLTTQFALGFSPLGQDA